MKAIDNQFSEAALASYAVIFGQLKLVQSILTFLLQARLCSVRVVLGVGWESPKSVGLGPDMCQKQVHASM